MFGQDWYMQYIKLIGAKVSPEAVTLGGFRKHDHEDSGGGLHQVNVAG